MQQITVRTGIAPNGGLPIAYEDWGDESAPPLLLIMGIGAQMLLWPDEFCRTLVEQGYRVIRFDNRDVGLSGKTSGRRRQPLWLLILRAQLGWQSAVPYTLADMAADAVQLLDHLQIRQAHVLGGSMGGMIAQVLAAEYPQRVRSLIVLFSSTNQPLLPPPAPSLLFQLLRPFPVKASRAQQQHYCKTRLRLLASKRYPMQEPEAGCAGQPAVAARRRQRRAAAPVFRPVGQRRSAALQPAYSGADAGDPRQRRPDGAQGRGRSGGAGGSACQAAYCAGYGP